MPRSATVTSARAWSSTKSQSRTFWPWPYTGRASPSMALMIVNGISFSGKWYGP